MGAAGPITGNGRTARPYLVALGVLTALAFGLRITGIDQSLYQDEYFTHAIVSGNGLTGVWHDVFHTSITPPLHYVLAWFALHLGHDDTVLIRLPSLIFGTALVPVTFVLARRAGGDRAGLLAAVLMALSPFAIWYSDEARAYATMMFLVALSTLALLRAVNGGARWWWVVYALSACAALWSHYTAVFVVVAEGAWALWTHRERWRELAYAQAAIAVGYLPWLPGFLEQRQNHVGIEVINQFSDLNFGRVFELPLRTLVGHPGVGLADLPGTRGLLLVLALAALILATAVVRPAALRQLAPSLRSERGLVVILALATPVGLLLYAVAGPTLYLPRNLSASLPALVVLVALLLDVLVAAVPPRVAVVAVVGVVVVLALGAVASVGGNYQRPPYREAARYLDGVAGRNDPVVETALIPAFDKRFRRTTLDLYFERKHPLYPADLGDSAAWRQLREGRTVYLVAPARGFFAPAQVTRRRQRDMRAPAGQVQRIDQLGGPDGRAVLQGVKTFAGLIPIAVLRFAGVVEGRLAGRRGQEIISWSLGKHVSVSRGAARGSVEGVTPSNKPLLITGWALEARRPEPVDWVLFFSRGRLFAVSAGGGRRPDIARTYGPSALASGFGLGAPDAPSDHATIRVFAVVGSRASELPFSAVARKTAG